MAYANWVDEKKRRKKTGSPRWRARKSRRGKNIGAPRAKEKETEKEINSV